MVQWLTTATIMDTNCRLVPAGGPLFFEHYSFLGINPNGLTDAYATIQHKQKIIPS
jgi:hypothetical protein